MSPSLLPPADLLRANFAQVVEGRGLPGVGWHWKIGSDRRAHPPYRRSQVPAPLRPLFDQLQDQWLQWDASDDVDGAFVVLPADAFETPIGEAEIAVGRTRRGRLYAWGDALAYVDGEDERTHSAVFVDDADPGFCWIVLRIEGETAWSPLALDMEEFLLLLAHTRGVSGLHYALARGCSGPFLRRVRAMRRFFPDMDLDLCLRLLRKQQAVHLAREYAGFQPQLPTDVQVRLSGRGYLVTIEGETIGEPADPALSLDLLRELRERLESRLAWDHAAWAYLDSLKLGVIHIDKDNLIVSSQRAGPGAARQEAGCDAGTFYRALVECTAELAQAAERDEAIGRSLPNLPEWQSELEAMRVLVDFLYGR